MTRKEARTVLRALADWEPRGTSVELVDADRRNLRESAAGAIAHSLGFYEEDALTILDAYRMTA